MSFVPDITTAKGRKEIASLAYKVAQTKTYLDGLGKDLVAELKEIPKLIDANRNEPPRKSWRLNFLRKR
ncbi:hypothetical protein BBZ50_02590 [Escherichia coli]|nr:hypothetical protein BBZ51_02515 [Escherichia coli]OCS76825.1 hypothetical protein BBZ50_02590 [Escherichia coli]ODB50718.1 hypothetical protein A9J89_02515 [Escherichia coli]